MSDTSTVTIETEAKSEFFEQLVASPDGERFLTCVQCGVCAGSCPLGHAMPFPPRRILLHARQPDHAELIESHSVWMCVGCYTCSKRCPRGLELTDGLWPLLRDRAMQLGKQPPPELQTAFQNIYTYGNLLGQSPRKRLDWAQGLQPKVRDLSKEPGPVEVLWLVGCYPSYYPRNRRVTRGFARLLGALGVDYGVLGKKEKALGDCDRLFGEEGLFETLVESNSELLSHFEFGKIVLLDPHALRALDRFYPRYGTSFPAEHYTTFLASKLDRLKPLLMHPVPAKVTYHDNCCVGRRCGCFEPPRELLRAIPGIELVEMRKNRDNSLCCGGGGGGMWLDAFITEHGGHRLSDERIRMAADTGADTLAVSCPYELSRFEDAAKVAGLESQLRVRDIIELLVASAGIQEE